LASVGFSRSSSCWAGRTAATSSKVSKKAAKYFKLAMDMFTGLKLKGNRELDTENR
jgi:hypothetical protein